MVQDQITDRDRVDAFLDYVKEFDMEACWELTNSAISACTKEDLQHIERTKLIVQNVLLRKFFAGRGEIAQLENVLDSLASLSSTRNDSNIDREIQVFKDKFTNEKDGYQSKADGSRGDPLMTIGIDGRPLSEKTNVETILYGGELHGDIDKHQTRVSNGDFFNISTQISASITRAELVHEIRDFIIREHL